MNLEIYIEGKKMDVDDKSTKIAQTIQHFDFLAVGKSIKANRTNRVNLPLTNNNITVLEQIAPLSIITTKPYQNLSIRIVLEGIEVIPSGFCQITGISDRIELDSQSGIKGFWDALENKYLNDIDLSAWSGTWNNTRRDGVRNTTSGLVCPIVDNGVFLEVGLIDFSAVNELRSNVFVPVFYYKTIMDKIFDLVGYTKSGSIFSDTKRYDKLAITTRLFYTNQFLDAKIVNVLKTSPQTVTEGVETRLTFNSFLSGSDGFWDSTNNQYKVTYTPSTLKYFRGKFHLRTSSTLNTGFASGVLNLYVNGVNVESFAFGDYDETFTTNEYDFKHNDTVYFNILVTAFPPGGTYQAVEKANLVFEPSNTTDSDVVQKSDWYWSFSDLMPRILIRDFIRDFMIMFGLVIREKNKNVEFKTIQEIVSELPTSTLEVSRRDTTQDPDVSYEISGFAQKNVFLWEVQENLFLLSNYGSGFFSVSNTTLKLEDEFRKSIFTASDSTSTLSITNIAKYVTFSAGAQSNCASFGFRLMLIRDSSALTRFIVGGPDRTDCKAGYFIDSLQTYSLDWQQIINEYYAGYAAVLNQYAEIEEQLLIRMDEIANIDLFKPKSRDGVNYIIEKIKNYVPGKFAKVTLIKL